MAIKYATDGDIADYLRVGYWQQKGTPRPYFKTLDITYNLSNIRGNGDAALALIEKQIAQNSLDLWSDIGGFRFIETTGSAMINFTDAGSRLDAYATPSYSNGIYASSTITISTVWAINSGTVGDTYLQQTYIHEIGHALGLGHAGPYNFDATWGTSNIFSNDTWQHSIMFYFPQDNFDKSTAGYLQTPMMADIIAIRRIYGERQTVPWEFSTRTENNTYGFNSNSGDLYNFEKRSSGVFMTIVDDGGYDTIDLSGYYQNQRIFSYSGGYSSVGGTRTI